MPEQVEQAAHLNQTQQRTRDAKQRVRAAVRASRAAMTVDDQRIARDQLTSQLVQLVDAVAPARVTCFLPAAGEPDTTGFLHLAKARSIDVLLPVSLPGGQLDWARFTEAGVAPGRHGILEPSSPRLGSAALSTADLILIPACAVDTSGIRLGWGLGYYDRALASLKTPSPVFAVVHDADLVDALPREPHDIPVDGVVTPTRTLRFGTETSG